MNRRLFTILAALSLLLCVAVCVLWVRSYWVGDVLLEVRQEGAGRSQGGVFSASGVFGWWRDHSVAISPDPAGDWARMDKEAGTKVGDGWYWYRADPPYVPGEEVMLTDQWNVLSFGWAVWDQQYVVNPTFTWGISWRRVMVPSWSLAFATGLLPLTALWRWWRRHHLRPGTCLHCGYDLRATPERCPECGNMADADPVR